jgi:hypothetical protein
MYGEVRLVLSRVRQGLCLDVFCRVKQKRASPASQRAGVNPTNLTGSRAVIQVILNLYIIQLNTMQSEPVRWLTCIV